MSLFPFELNEIIYIELEIDRHGGMLLESVLDVAAATTSINLLIYWASNVNEVSFFGHDTTMTIYICNVIQ